MQFYRTEASRRRKRKNCSGENLLPKKLFQTKVRKPYDFTFILALLDKFNIIPMNHVLTIINVTTINKNSKSINDALYYRI